MKNETWKILAIVFIALFVFETLFIIWGIVGGDRRINNEIECEIDICGNANYDAYYYDAYYEICYCYKNRELVYQEDMR